METKQTAVEWLLQQVNRKSWGNCVVDIPKETIDQALKMEQEQYDHAFDYGVKSSFINMPYKDPVGNESVVAVSITELLQSIRKEQIDAAYLRYLQGDNKWANQTQVDTNAGTMSVPTHYTREEFEEKVTTDAEFARLTGMTSKPKSAVEWLQVCMSIHLTHEQKMQFEGLFQQAMGMELQGQMEAHTSGFLDAYGYPEKTLKDEDDAYDQRYT